MSHKVIDTIRLTNFRNITHLKLDIPSRITLISGSNGLGKTNLLDALVRINTPRGLKNQTSKDCINMLNPHYGWGIGLSLSNQDIVQYGRTQNHDKMLYHYNQTPISHDILRQKIPVLWLSPVGEKLFTEEHQCIRAYIDSLIALCFPTLNALKLDYDKALKQRLKLLHDNADKKWITALEFEIANNAIQIIRLRHTFLEIFIQSYDAIIADTRQGFPPFTLDILCDTKDYPTIDQYQHKLRAMRDNDSSTGRSLFGTHRSRIHVMHVQKNIDIYYCSTGEQKAILSHILLCMNHLLQTKNNTVPMMLFDDALAHYDNNRIQFFYDYMQYYSHNQFFLTNTEFTTNISTYPDVCLLPLERALTLENKLLF